MDCCFNFFCYNYFFIDCCYVFYEKEKVINELSEFWVFMEIGGDI